MFYSFVCMTFFPQRALHTRQSFAICWFGDWRMVSWSPESGGGGSMSFRPAREAPSEPDTLPPA